MSRQSLQFPAPAPHFHHTDPHHNQHDPAEIHHPQLLADQQDATPTRQTRPHPPNCASPATGPAP